MAQLGELGLSRELLRRAARAFGPNEAVARARCVVAEAEVALAARDLQEPVQKLRAAVSTLAARGDRANALHGRLSLARSLLLLGRVEAAADALAELELAAAEPAQLAIAALVEAEIALRRLKTAPARAALERARLASVRARIPALAAEVERAFAALEAPAARLLHAERVESLPLAAVEALFGSDALIVDGCRRQVSGIPAARGARRVVALARRPILFSLAHELASAWPGGASRDRLVAEVFGARRVNETHRARLRVEVGRLRSLLAPLAELHATPEGFGLVPRRGRRVVVLDPPIEGDDAALLALLADGEAWSTSALALALGASQRNVQRALSALESSGKVRSIGRARARRWLAPGLAGFATTLLLPLASTPS